MARPCTAPALAALVLARSALAAPPPESRTGAYSRYELETITQASRDLSLEEDPSPEGKTLEGIDVVTLDVIEPRDPAPLFLNKLHVTSRDYIIRREVLLKVGEPYAKITVDETARNIRSLIPLSVVLCVPVRGSSPDKVKLLVITKDIWSLRLAYDMSLGQGGFETLLIQPSEINVGGLHQSASATFILQPKSYSIGGRYAIPRVLGSRVAASVEGGVIMNREQSAAEGSFLKAAVEQPLFSTRAEWAFRVSGAFRTEVVRRYVNARVAAYNAQATPGADDLPFAYRDLQQGAGAAVTRSFGWALKNDFSLGFEGSRRATGLASQERYAAAPEAIDEFLERKVPRSDTRVGPFVQWRTYSTSFMRVFDLETLALQEDYRLGHDVYLRLYPVATQLGATRSFLGAFAGAQYTVPLGDGFARAVVESTTEAEESRLADASLAVALRIATPRTPAGRLVLDAQALNRYRNYLTRNTFLGGDGRLRGYPSNFFVGKDVVVYNVEYRTRPVELLSCQLGGAVFYDVGDAFDGFSALRARQGAGVGLRALFPQLNRVVMRADVAAPLSTQGLPQRISPVTYFISFEQAFATPVVAP